jgi:hypothetical protein
MNDYTDIPQPPDEANAATVLVRLVDGIAFRYRWATEKLPEESLRLQPSEDSWTLRELLEHVRGLASWIAGIIDAPLPERDKSGDLVAQLRKETLALLSNIRGHLLTMDSGRLEKIVIEGKIENYPFWNLINGPLADILTHVGQISSLRRMHGHHQPKANVFAGTGPQDSLGGT